MISISIFDLLGMFFQILKYASKESTLVTKDIHIVEHYEGSIEAYSHHSGTFLGHLSKNPKNSVSWLPFCKCILTLNPSKYSPKIFQLV